jgi:hypothetical protein
METKNNGNPKQSTAMPNEPAHQEEVQQDEKHGVSDNTLIELMITYDNPEEDSKPQAIQPNDELPRWCSWHSHVEMASK